MLASAPAASGDHIPKTGKRINVFVPPSTFPSNTPFWIGSAIGTSLDNKLTILDPRTRIELYVDGESKPMLTDISFTADTATKLNLANFRFGLPLGVHHFEQLVYLEGVFQFSSTADITFV